MHLPLGNLGYLGTPRVFSTKPYFIIIHLIETIKMESDLSRWLYNYEKTSTLQYLYEVVHAKDVKTAESSHNLHLSDLPPSLMHSTMVLAPYNDNQ